MQKTAMVTGAGSGVGRATARRLIEAGWRVALIGRHEATLKESIADIQGGRENAITIACDVAKPDDVRAMARRMIEWSGGALSALVNAAGTNTPKRAWEVLSYESYRELIDVNLTGTFLCVQAFLPQLRKAGGTIVNIVSDAALAASPKAGPAYVASKFGQRGLTQSINAEERGNGVRACAVLPGDIDTPLLERRPTPPDAAARGRMLQPEDVAECVMLCINLPPRAIVEELLVRPR